MSCLGSYIFWPDPELMRKQGYASISHVPTIFHSDWKYHEEASRYLRERSSPTREDVARGLFGSQREPTVASLKSYAERLVNFLDWCTIQGSRAKVSNPSIFWQKVTYDDVKLYGREQETGTFSTIGKLSVTTIELRKDTAVEFLEWAAARGYRDSIAVPKRRVRLRISSSTNSHALSFEIERRSDKRRVTKANLHIPSDQEIKAWLQSLKLRFGPTKYLMAELILNTGIRINEAVNWRIDTLPHDKSKWRISRVSSGYVTVQLIYGTKGPKSDGPAGNNGPPRNITISLSLAEKLWHYQEYTRPALLRLYVKQGKTREEQARRRLNIPNHLFLSDYLGIPVTIHRLRNAWKGAEPLPFKEWHPHFGRDYWACKTLLLELQRQIEVAKIQQGHGLVTNWMQSSAETIIETKIRPQLGHASATTTNKYIEWAVAAFDLTVLHDMYSRTIADVCE